MIEKILKRFKGESFLKDTVILMTGTAIAQAIPILISPILTRIYPAEEFGLLSIVSFIVFLLGVTLSLKYEMAIILPHKEVDGDNLYVLSIIIAFIISTLLFLTLTFTANPIAKLFNTPNLSKLLPWTAIAGFFLMFFNASYYYLIRNKKFLDVSISKVTRTGTTGLSQVLLGVIKVNTGLSKGFMIGQILGNIYYFFSIDFKKIIKNTRKIKLIALFKRYKQFPLINLPATFLNRISTEIYNIILPILFDMKILGFYYLAYKMTIAPISFIGLSTADVFFKRANEELKKKGHIKNLYYKVLIKIIIISAPFYIFLFFFSIPIFTFIFGENWYLAGLFSKILAPWLFIRFIYTSVSNTIIIFEKLKIKFIIQFINVIVSISIFILADYFNWTIKTWIIIFSSGMTVVYLFGLGIITFLVHQQYLNKIK